MLQGVNAGYVSGLRGAYWFSFFLILLYLVSYVIWAGNLLGVVLDDQVNDRYVNITFWRIAGVGLDLFTPYLTLYYLYNTLFRGVRILHCWLVVLTIFLEAALFVWYIIDVIDCTNVAHCFGSGSGPLGIDVAFWVVLATVALRLLINLLFLYINFYIKRRVEFRGILDYYANPNRQPLYGNTSAYLQRSTLPANFIGGEIGVDDIRLGHCGDGGVGGYSKGKGSVLRDDRETEREHMDRLHGMIARNAHNIPMSRPDYLVQWALEAQNMHHMA